MLTIVFSQTSGPVPGCRFVVRNAKYWREIEKPDDYIRETNNVCYSVNKSPAGVIPKNTKLWVTYRGIRRLEGGGIFECSGGIEKQGATRYCLILSGPNKNKIIKCSDLGCAHPGTNSPNYCINSSHISERKCV